MLHTDTFNKSNRHKMTKADYVKNTSLPGVEAEILEVTIFDTITHQIAQSSILVFL